MPPLTKEEEELHFCMVPTEFWNVKTSQLGNMVKLVNFQASATQPAPRRERQMERDLVRVIVSEGERAARRGDRQGGSNAFYSSTPYFFSRGASDQIHHSTASYQHDPYRPHAHAYAVQGIYTTHSARYPEDEVLPQLHRRRQVEVYNGTFGLSQPPEARPVNHAMVRHQQYVADPYITDATYLPLCGPPIPQQTLPPKPPSYSKEHWQVQNSRLDAPKLPPLRPSGSSNNQGLGVPTGSGKESNQSVRSIAVPKDQENQRTTSKKFKSPVTLCFERILGAADFLANNQTPDNVKKRLTLKVEGEPASSPTDDADRTKRKPEESLDVSEDKKPNAKRARNYRPFFTTSEQVERLVETDPSNPFVELVNNEHLYYRIILLMTLEAENKDSKKTSESNEPVSNVIGEGFFWRDYPELESLLYRNMDSYYSVSVSERQSRVQQKFNNHIVSAIRSTAEAAGYSFDPNFTDKRLRDRIRCFYKTHLQNAKKRLATMQKNPKSVLNQTQLRLWIEEAKEKMQSGPMPKDDADLEDEYRRVLEHS